MTNVPMTPKQTFTYPHPHPPQSPTCTESGALGGRARRASRSPFSTIHTMYRAQRHLSRWRRMPSSQFRIGCWPRQRSRRQTKIGRSKAGQVRHAASCDGRDGDIAPARALKADSFFGGAQIPARLLSQRATNHLARVYMCLAYDVRAWELVYDTTSGSKTTRALVLSAAAQRAGA